MEKKAYIYINYKNIEVIKTYLDIIATALRANNYDTSFVTTLNKIPKSSLIVYPMAIDAFKYYIKGYRNFILWQQGVTGEESYMRNKSNVRRYLLNKIDSYMMEKARLIFFVSNELRNYYEKFSNQDFKSKSYVMPCFNESLNIEILKNKNYTRRMFTYVGSLDLWQCFDKTVYIYKYIEDSIPGTFFKVLTFQVDEAVSYLKKAGVKHFEVKKVPKELVQKELEDCTYGFIIRDDTVVNRVATPTKISSYLSCGVLPIYSSSLIDFFNIAMNCECMIRLDSSNEKQRMNDLVKKINIDIDYKKAINEISYVFNEYYSKDKHVKMISKMLKDDYL